MKDFLGQEIKLWDAVVANRWGYNHKAVIIGFTDQCVIVNFTFLNKKFEVEVFPEEIVCIHGVAKGGE